MEQYSLEPIYEGNFLRYMLKLTNVIDNVKSIANLITDHLLIKKLEKMNELIVRDIITTNSLYIA